MKKRGFTLIEIIVSIAIIALIGVGSFVGVRYVNEKIRINKLSQITDKAIMAADVWIESNKEASNQLYSERNAVFVPLTHLVNDGLLSLDNTDLTLDNIKGEYVIKALSGEGKDTSCDEIKTVTSWDKSNPLYICTHLNNDGSTSSNISIIDPDKTSNMNKASREPYYFKGIDPKNFVKYGEKRYRILYINNDDSLVLFDSNLYNNYDFSSRKWVYDNSFNGYTNNLSFVYGSALISVCNGTGYYSVKTPYSNISSYNLSYGWNVIDAFDIMHAGECIENVYRNWLTYLYRADSSYNWGTAEVFTKINLKNCFKITSGIGDSANPYILENKCPST